MVCHKHEMHCDGTGGAALAVGRLKTRSKQVCTRCFTEQHHTTTPLFGRAVFNAGAREMPGRGLQRR